MYEFDILGRQNYFYIDWGPILNIVYIDSNSTEFEEVVIYGPSILNDMHLFIKL